MSSVPEDSAPRLTKESIVAAIEAIWNAPPRQIAVHPLHGELMRRQAQLARRMDKINAAVLAHTSGATDAGRATQDLIDRAESDLGITLLSWQRETVARMLSGDLMAITLPAKAGKTLMGRVIARCEEIADEEAAR